MHYKNSAIEFIKTLLLFAKNNNAVKFKCCNTKMNKL